MAYLFDIQGASLDLGTRHSLTNWTHWYSIPITFRHCGYVRSDQWYQFKMFNGLDTPTTVTAIGGPDDGIFFYSNLSEGALSFPFDINPNTYVDVFFKVTSIGDLDFEDTFEIQTSEENRSIVFKGVRPPYVPGDGIIGLLKHNWAEGLQEVREWNTDTLTSYNRTEQRMQLRIEPRRYYEWRGIVTKENKQIYESMLFNRSILWYLLPVWHESLEMTQVASAGETSIYADINYHEYYQDKPVFIIDPSGGYEQHSIALVSADKIDLTTALVNNYPAGSAIVPGNYFEYAGDPSIEHYTSQIDVFTARFKTVYSDISDFTVAFEKYATHYLFPFVINFTNVSSSISHWWEVLDNNRVTEVIAKSNEPLHSRNLSLLLDNREDISKFFEFLYTIKGKLVPFWATTQTDDLTLVEPIAPTDMDIYVENSNYTVHWTNSFMRSVIEITLINGTVFRRTITDSIINPLDITQEVLTISGALGIAVNPTDILDIRFLELVRLSSDSVTMNWENINTLQVSLPIVSLAHTQLTI